MISFLYKFKPPKTELLLKTFNHFTLASFLPSINKILKKSMKKHKDFRSDFLFSDSGFFMGFGSVMNLAGNYFRFSGSPTEAEADRKALEADWGMVGQGICKASKSISKQKKAAIQQELSFE